jgi:hypothetical protein
MHIELLQRNCNQDTGCSVVRVMLNHTPAQQQVAKLVSFAQQWLCAMSCG